MIYITKADQTTHVETEIYFLGKTDGFYNIKINEKVNDYGSMTFSCIPSKANFKLNDIITVYKDNSVYWQGIIVSMTRDFYGNVNVTCYSMLWTLTFAELQETDCGSMGFQTAMANLEYRNGHDLGSGAVINSQYDFAFTFDNGGDDALLRRGIIMPFGTTLSQLQALCEEQFYFYAEYVKPFSTTYCVMVRIANYASPTRIVNQPINFGLNLLDYADENSIAAFKTSVAPIGKDANGDPLYVGSYPGQNGSGYIKNADPNIITEYGERRTRVEFEIDNVNDLYAAGVYWLANNAFSELTISLSAVDLSALSGLGYDEFALGHYVNIKATPFGFASLMPILERSIDLQDPSNSTITISNTYQATLTEYIRSANK